MLRRRPGLLVLALSLLVCLPSIRIGLYCDDYVLRTAVARTLPDAPPVYDLYRFADGVPAHDLRRVESGTLAWWTAPGLRLHLVRPLPSLLFALEDRLFGGAPLGYHVVSIALYLALVAAVGALVRRLFGAREATLAMLVFAVAPAHVFPWGWAACQHMTVAALLSVLALLALVRARQQEWQPGRWVAALALAVGLASGETAIGGLAYAVCYAALGARAGERWSRRAALVAPCLAVAAVYVAVYVAVGGGTARGGQYVSPLSEPGVFATAAARRLPVLLADATLGVTSELTAMAPVASISLVAIAGCALLFFVARPVLGDDARALRWLLPGALLALVAALGGFPGTRLRLLPDVGLSAVLGVVFARAFRRAPVDRPVALWLRRAGAGLLAAIHGVLAPVVAFAVTSTNARVARQVEALAGDVARLVAPGDRIFLLAASDPMVSMYPPGVLLAGSPAWASSCWSAASTAKATHRITRTGPATLELETEDATMLRGPFETLYRGEGDPMHQGDSARQCGATYRVLEVRDGRPTHIELALDVPLEDPHVRLLAWQNGRLAPVALPHVGDGVEIPWSPGPIGIF